MPSYPSLSLVVEVWRAGAQVASLAAESASVEHALMGGCVSGEFEFARTWADPLVALPGDEIRLLVDGQQHFAGQVDPVDRELTLGGAQKLRASGWWARLRRVFVPPPGDRDRTEFGVEGADHPTIATAHELAQWLIEEHVLADPVARVTASAYVSAPAHSTKLGLFSLYAGTSVADALEQLATMDDSAAGIDAAGRLYLLPRTTLLAGSPQVHARLAHTPTTSGFLSEVMVLGGAVREEHDPVVKVGVAGRDVNRSRGLRVYELADPPAPGRRVDYYVPGIQRGQAARRFALGKLRRFGVVGTRLVRCAFATGSAAPVEPRRGFVRLRDVDGSTILDEGLVGSIRIAYGPDLTFDLTVGELATEPGSGDPANDPFAPEATVIDDPMIDVGDSGTIDLDDGFDGDGDDLHSNPDRETPEDPGEGEDLDYGSDEADETNGASFSYLLTPRAAVITGKPATGLYNVTLLDAQGNTTGETYELLETFPEVLDDSLAIEQQVLVFWPGVGKAIKPRVVTGIGGGSGGGSGVFAFVAGGAFWGA